MKNGQGKASKIQSLQGRKSQLFSFEVYCQNSICGDCAKWPCSAFLGGVEMYISNVLTTKTKCLK